MIPAARRAEQNSAYSPARTLPHPAVPFQIEHLGVHHRQNPRMRTIIGLIALVLVAAALFVVVGLNNIKSQERYAARLRSQPLSAVVAADESTATNAIHQAQEKSKNENL